MDRKYYLNIDHEVTLTPWSEYDYLLMQMNEHDFYQINKGSRDSTVSVVHPIDGTMVVPISSVSYYDQANRLYHTSAPELRAIGERAGRTAGQLSYYDPDQRIAVDMSLLTALRELQAKTYEVENHWMAWKMREARAKRIEELEKKNDQEATRGDTQSTDTPP